LLEQVRDTHTRGQSRNDKNTNARKTKADDSSDE